MSLTHRSWALSLTERTPDHHTALSEISNRIVGKILRHTIWYHALFYFRLMMWGLQILLFCPRDSLVWRRSMECQLCEDKEVLIRNPSIWAAVMIQLSDNTIVGVVVQCINHSPITQEPHVHFQVETIQYHKRLNKQPIKAALLCASKVAPPSGHSWTTKSRAKTIGSPHNLPTSSHRSLKLIHV